MVNARNLARRTKPGLVKDLYRAQVSNSRRHKRPTPTYTEEWFTDWMYNQRLLHVLYDSWVNSGYVKNLRPSVDRVDSSLSYTEGNIQLMTFGENNSKQDKDYVEILQQWSEDGKRLIREYISREEARKSTGVIGTNISKCIKGKRPRAGGFVWKIRYKNNEISRY